MKNITRSLSQQQTSKESNCIFPTALFHYHRPLGVKRSETVHQWQRSTARDKETDANITLLEEQTLNTGPVCSVILLKSRCRLLFCNRTAAASTITHSKKQRLQTESPTSCVHCLDLNLPTSVSAKVQAWAQWSDMDFRGCR